MTGTSSHTVDIVIIGAGIAGLWLNAALRAQGYSTLVLEKDAIGGGQTLASQGIIHSGLKYAFAGKINKLAQNISAMPDRWRAALRGEGAVDLSTARMNTESQYLLIPSGFMGGLVKLVTAKTLGESVHEIPKADWPEDIKQSGFKGSVIFMGEPVLDVPSVLRALAEPYRDSIRCLPLCHSEAHSDEESGACKNQILHFVQDDNKIIIGEHTITAQKIIYTAAASNHVTAKSASHDAGLDTQARPLLMGMLKPAPFEAYVHLVGSSDKPVATITTHQCEDGTLAWYLGGAVAERDKDSDPASVYDAARKGFAKYLPALDLSSVQWATLPIDRIEGKSEIDSWMPDTPTIHGAGNTYYCWPTKLTFAPLLADRMLDKLQSDGVQAAADQSAWDFLPEAPFGIAPWDAAHWTK